MSIYRASMMVLLKSIENTDVKSVEKLFCMKPVVLAEYRGWQYEDIYHRICSIFVDTDNWDYEDIKEVMEWRLI